MTAPRLCAIAAIALVAAGCGKRGDPLPPLRPVPARIVDLALSRTADRVELQFTVPAANLDGTTPPAVDRIDVYGWPAPAGAAPPSASAIVADSRNLRSRLVVRRVAEPGTSTTAPASLAPGERAVVVDTLQALAGTPPAFIYYVVVPVAGSGRGRQGPPSAPAAVPLGALPATPTGLTLSHDETETRASWQAGAPGQVFRLIRTTSTGVAAGVPQMIPTPPTSTELRFPVEFGREACVAVRAQQVAGAVSVEGEWSPPACLTPIDRYAPSAPGGLQAVQQGPAVILIWTAVAASDLAGYVVLRGTGAGNDLQPLMRTPIRETTYRDAAVQPGMTYAYAVYAVDTAATPNVSQLSARQNVTVR